MYHYLTGSASWMVLTELTQVFGVRGLRGDLVLAPQLVKEEFDKKGQASVTCPFAGHNITVQYHNPRKLDAGSYAVAGINVEGKPIDFERLDPAFVRVPRRLVTQNTVFTVILASS